MKKEEKEIFEAEKPPKMVEVKELYGISITIDEYHNHKNVVMGIFRWNTKNVPFNPKEFVPVGVPKNQDVLDDLKEHFTLDEIQQIKDYLKRFKGTTIGESYPCSLPEEGNVLPTGAIPTGGPQDFYLFYESENYPLPFDIAGYFDLRRHKKIDPDKPEDYMRILKVKNKKGKELTLVINPDHEYIKRIKNKQQNTQE